MSPRHLRPQTWLAMEDLKLQPFGYHPNALPVELLAKTLCGRWEATLSPICLIAGPSLLANHFGSRLLLGRASTSPFKLDNYLDWWRRGLTEAVTKSGSLGVMVLRSNRWVTM